MSNDRPTALFPDNMNSTTFRARWDKTQISFVDESPRAAVEQADSLVATVVKRLAEQFAAERADLESTSGTCGTEVSTGGDLRQALRKYRSFFDRLLAFSKTERARRKPFSWHLMELPQTSAPSSRRFYRQRGWGIFVVAKKPGRIQSRERQNRKP